MVSQTTRYGLIILGHLADRRDTWCPVDEIARATCIPANYLAKILNRLAKEGVVDSLKGWGGGYRLRPSAAERPIRDVILILEGSEPDVIQECMFGLPQCDEKAPCPLHEHWRGIRESYERMMSGISIGELRSDGASSARRRCEEDATRPKRRAVASAPAPSKASRSSDPKPKRKRRASTPARRSSGG